MKRKTLAIYLLLLTCLTFAQEIVNDKELTTDFDKRASFNEGDLNVFFSNTIDYPLNARINGEEGLVVLSFIIRKDGTIDSIVPVEYSSKEFAVSAILFLEKTNKKWDPTILNGNPIDFDYKIAIQYSMSIYYLQTDYWSKAEKQIRKGNYSKAINICTKAIKNKPYDYEFYQMRYLAKTKNGNASGALNDSLRMVSLKNKFVGKFYVTLVAH